MIVKIKKLHPDAEIPFKTYPSDFCFDCVAVSEEEVAPNVWKYGLGFALQIERNWVDENFTNEISAVFYHVMPNMPRYKVGDKICQCKIGITFPITFIEVDELEERDRGMNGYGSTGK